MPARALDDQDRAMLDVRDAIPTIRNLAKAEFTTLRFRLLKVAARIVETRHRVRRTHIDKSTDGAPLRRNPHARGVTRQS